MDELDPDPRVTFGRHRRNLLAVSLVLLAFQSTGATFHHLTIFGETIDLTQPLDITTPLWLAWVYFSARAYQHYREIPGGPVAVRFKDRLAIVAGMIARRLAKRRLRKTIDPTMIRPSRVRLADDRASIVDYQPYYWRFELDGTASVSETSGGTRDSTIVLERYQVDMPTGRLWECRWRAGVWLTLHTPVVTDFILPLVVAALPVAKWSAGWLRQHWPL